MPWLSQTSPVSEADMDSWAVLCQTLEPSYPHCRPALVTPGTRFDRLQNSTCVTEMLGGRAVVHGGGGCSQEPRNPHRRALNYG